MRQELEPLFTKGFSGVDFDIWKEACSKDVDLFMEFWIIAQDPDKAYAWRALWVIEHAIHKNDSLIDLILEELVQLIIQTDNNSLDRIGLKIINIRPIKNDDAAALLLNKCEKLIMNTRIPVATRANALLYFFNFCKIEPELANELKAIMDHIEEQESSAGLKARFRFIRKELSKF